MPKSNTEIHLDNQSHLPELEQLKSEYVDIYNELMAQFRFDEKTCQEWLITPKRPLQGKSPFEQLIINADEVMGLLVRMKTGDFS
ncbi:hypothetical protein [Litorilituus sediminis]|uniref:DUF2384 domain-containing protein n=1 Tax=Litorilituus sediminis TaxID=718192 RepID=A0A4P6P162_9GAMM|nr:hypothetical protein [Litorilituus sediminis]QBG34801.1 hypothetical protein EMK97_03115 [Litorilituus sediminis]